MRDELVACRAQLSEAGVDGVEEIDSHVEELIKAAKQAAAGTAAAVVFRAILDVPKPKYGGAPNLCEDLY